MSKVQYKSYEDLLGKRSTRIEKIQKAEERHKYLQKLYEALTILLDDFEKWTFMHNRFYAEKRTEFLKKVSKATETDISRHYHLINLKELADDVKREREYGLSKMAKDKQMVEKMNYIIRYDLNKEIDNGF